MRKLKRRKVIKSFLEDKIAKNQGKIVKLSEINFELRKQLEYLNSLPVNKPLTKADREAPVTVPATPENTEAVTDSADQEIGMGGQL